MPMIAPRRTRGGIHPERSKYSCDRGIVVLQQFSGALTAGGLAPHIQIMERVLERKSCACEPANRACDLRIRHITLWIILPVEGQNASVVPSFLLPRLVQREEVADIGGDYSTLVDSSMLEMRFILRTSHCYRPWGHDLVPFLLQEADEHIRIHVIIEVESHREAGESSAKNPCSSSHTCSASLSAQITSQWSWQYANASNTAASGRSRF